MGVDIATHRSRIGCCRQNSGHDVVQFTVHVNFTYTLKWLCTLPLVLFILLMFINRNVLFDNGTFDLNVLDLTKSTSIFTGFHMYIAGGAKNLECKCPGSVAFIGILLVMAGIEINPGPLPNEDETTKKDTIPEAPQTPTNDSQSSARSNSGYNDGSGDEYFDAEEDKKFEDSLKSNTDESSDSMAFLIKATGTQTDIEIPVQVRTTDTQTDIITPVPMQTTDTQTDDTRKELKSSEVQTFSKTDILEQQALTVRCKMGLADYLHNKISLRDVMKISTKPNVPGNTNIIWTLLQELIMVNFEARDRCPHELYRQGLKESTFHNSESSDENSDDDAKHKDNFNIDILKNHDIFITIFNCCNHSLKQVLVSKMFLCRLAVPLIYPTFQSGSFCFSLWPYRSITLDVKEKIHSSLFLVNYPQKVVSFVRLCRPKFSKSLLLNAVISNQQNQHHPTFYNKDCLLGTHKREITNGLVEASWYMPCAQENDVFHDMIMFTNLRGDAFDHVDQMKILTGISNCVVITVDFGDVEKYLDILKDIQYQASSVIVLLTGKKIRSVLKYFENQRTTVITLFDKGEEKNISTLRIELQEKISVILQNSTDTCIEDCASCALQQGIQVDEWSGDCPLSKQTAVLLSKRLEDFHSTDVKRKLLPLQEVWKDISKQTKILKRISTSGIPSASSDDSDASSTLWTKEPIKNEIAKLRCDQSRLCGDSYSLAYMFIQVLALNIESNEYISYFLEWIRFHFDKRSHMVLPELMNEYHKSWEKYNESKQQDQHKDVEILKDEMRISEQRLLDASIGLEHIFRELGQLYESSAECKSQHISPKQKILFDGLPDIAAKLLVLGYPLELMDGDAVNVPTVWIKSVFDACIKLVGDKKVFIISILGVQSSGKSTFLNSLFGLQFSVSAGRCTRGIYLQMMPVDPTHGLPVEYLLVVDTEGLRAPELAFQRYDHDNELATLAVGIADMTIVNVKGENTSEVKDVLEIVIHALLRLKLANANLHFNTSCTFVHQNVSASNAASKMQLGRQKLLELLDEVTREAALEVGIKDTQTFQQVIQFDTKTDVWYVPDLWNGDPPMAHINPGYSRKIASIKSSIIQQIRSKGCTPRSLSRTIIHILDLWNGILSEDFVFSFRNSTEVKVYNIMESEYRKQTWALQEFQMDWMVRNVDKIGHHLSENEFEKDFRSMCEEIFLKLKSFFDISPYKDELIKWKGTQLIAFRHFSDDLIKRTKIEFFQIRQQKNLQEKTRKMNEGHLEEINEQAKALAKFLKGKKPSEKDLKNHFDDMWSKWLQKLSPVEHADSEPVEARIFSTLIGFKKQLQGNIFQEIENPKMNKTVTDLVHDSKRLRCEQDIHVHIRPFLESKRKLKNLGHRVFTQQFNEKCRVKTEQFQRGIFSSVVLQVTQDKSNLNVRFQNGHLDQLLNMIDSKIDEHNNDPDNEFEFLPQYRAMIMVYVSRYVLHVFTEVNERYDREYSPRAIIEKYKGTAWSFFKNLVDEKTHDIIAATFVCEAMKAKLNETLHPHVAITIESRVRAYFSHSKFSLIVKILDHLADQDGFENYTEYLSSSASYALKWITDYTNDRFFNKCEYIDVVSDYVAECAEKFKRDINEAGERCKTKTKNRMEAFISFVKTVPIPNHTVKEMCEYELNDVDNFLSEMRQMLSELQMEIIEDHKKKSPDSINWSKSPYTGIYQGLWGCDEECPFCKEPCQKMENHADAKEPHTCIQHRPKGVGGRNWIYSDKLVIESCSFAVQSDMHGTCWGFRNGCKTYSDCKSETIVFHPFRNYKIYLPDWDIAPSSDMESSKYWMWFMARFSKELAEWHLSETPDIPDSWKSISKEEARNSLRMCYGF